jgi:hypothetical protein
MQMDAEEMSFADGSFDFIWSWASSTTPPTRGGF